MPTFSVITANFNSGDKLATTTRSVLEQTTDVEQIIIDGASTDVSIEVARRLTAEQPERVRLFSEPDGGVYDAMNKGIHLAAGRYLFFLGAGDRLLPGVLAKVAHLLPPHDRGFIYGDVLWSGRRYDGPFTSRKLCEKNICHQAIFYGREIFSRCGFYDLRYRTLADWEMNLRIFGNRQIPRKYIPVTIADFQAGGISMQGDQEFERDRLRLIRKYLGLKSYFHIAFVLLESRLRIRAGRLRLRIFQRFRRKPQ